MEDVPWLFLISTGPKPNARVDSHDVLSWILGASAGELLQEVRIHRSSRESKILWWFGPDPRKTSRNVVMRYISISPFYIYPRTPSDLGRTSKFWRKAGDQSWRALFPLLIVSLSRTWSFLRAREILPESQEGREVHGPAFRDFLWKCATNLLKIWMIWDKKTILLGTVHHFPSRQPYRTFINHFAFALDVWYFCDFICNNGLTHHENHAMLQPRIWKVPAFIHLGQLPSMLSSTTPFPALKMSTWASQGTQNESRHHLSSLPSGNLTWLLKMVHLRLIFTYKSWLSIAMLVYQRVPVIFPKKHQWKSLKQNLCNA